jgi:uncharacterized membrane protein HdeD (DUF308 family)
MRNVSWRWIHGIMGVLFVVGVVELLLAFWVSQQVSAPRAILIITLVGFLCLFRGIGEIVLAFELRQVANRFEQGL